MTIVNVAVSRTRAIVAQDTLVWTDGRPSHALKFRASRELVLGAWGEGWLTIELFHMLKHLSIDIAIERAPAVLQGMRPVQTDQHAVHLVGWSGPLQRVHARRFETRDRGETWETMLLEPAGDTWMHIIAPGRRDNIPRELRVPTDLASMFRLMQAQTAAYADDDSPVGGHALVYDVTERGIEFQDLGDLGVPIPPSLQTSAQVESSHASR